MIDTIKIQFIMPRVCHSWIQFLSNHQNHDLIGHRGFTGKYGKYTCRIWKSKTDRNFQITLEGSLTKSVLNHNVGTLRHFEIQNEIKRISNDFKTPIGRMYLRRLDISTNIELESPVSNYLNQILTMPRKYRADHPYSISFSNKTDKYKLILYNKGVEYTASKLNKLPFDEVLKSTSFSTNRLLRLEVQLRDSEQIRQIFKKPINCADLMDVESYGKIIKYWFNEVSKITWLPPHKELELKGKLNQKKCLGYFIQSTIDNTKVAEAMTLLDSYSKANPNHLKRNLLLRFQKLIREFKAVKSNGNLREEFQTKLAEAFSLNCTITSR